MQPSKLSKIVYNLVGKDYGCWILDLKNSVSLKKYVCGTGHSVEQIKENLKLYEMNKLEPYIINY